MSRRIPSFPQRGQAPLNTPVMELPDDSPAWLREAFQKARFTKEYVKYFSLVPDAIDSVGDESLINHGNVLSSAQFGDGNASMAEHFTSVRINVEDVAPSHRISQKTWSDSHFLADAAANFTANNYPAAAYPASVFLETDTYVTRYSNGAAWTQILAPALLPFLGLTASFPALRRSGAGLEAVLANESAFTTFKMSRALVNDTTNDNGDEIYVGKDANSSRLTIDVASSAQVFHAPSFLGRRARGSQSARSNVTDGDTILTVAGNAWSGATGYWAVAGMTFLVNGAVTDNQRPGSRIEFSANAPNAAPSVIASIFSAGLNLNGSLQCDSIVNDTGLAHGTYSPTLTGVTNVDSVTQDGPFKWLRLGNTIVVTGRLNIDPTAAGGTATAVRITLPVTSNIGNAYDAVGVATLSTQNPGKIAGDAANDAAQMTFLAQSTASETWGILFVYEVLP